MIVWMIWARNEPGGEVWLEESWDDDSKSGNEEGWAEAVAEARESYDSVVVMRSRVDFDAVLAAFEIPEVTLSGMVNTEDSAAVERDRILTSLQGLVTAIPAGEEGGRAQRRALKRAIHTIEEQS